MLIILYLFSALRLVYPQGVCVAARTRLFFGYCLESTFLHTGATLDTFLLNDGMGFLDFSFDGVVRAYSGA